MNRMGICPHLPISGIYDNILNSEVNPSDKIIKNNSKLSDSDVIVIKALRHIAGWDTKKINEVYNFVTPVTINSIIAKKTRKNVRLTYLTKIPEKFYNLAGEQYRGKTVKGTK